MSQNTDYSNIISLISLGIAFTTILANFIIALVSKNYDKKTKVLEIILNSAFKEYEMRTQLELDAANSEKRTPHILSFTEYIIFYSKMAEVLSKRNVTRSEIEQALKDNKDLIDSYYQFREDYRPEYHDCRTHENVGGEAGR